MDKFNLEIIAILLIAVVLVWLGIITFLLIKQNRFFAQFTQGVTKKDLKTILKNIASSLKKVSSEINHLDEQVGGIIKDNKSHLQKVGFIRFNPFSDTGGDQSFCLCILNEDNHGLVITSLHSREQTRIYAKAVKNGQADGFEFSKEEKEAVKAALKK